MQWLDVAGKVAIPLLLAVVTALTSWIFKIDERVYQLSVNAPSAAEHATLVRDVQELKPVIQSNTDWRKSVEAELSRRGERLATIEANDTAHFALDTERWTQMQGRLDRVESRYQTLMQDLHVGLKRRDDRQQ